MHVAAKRKPTKKKPWERNYVTPKARPEIAEIAAELQKVQRMRATVMKTRVMNSNRLLHTIAGGMGYSTDLKEKARLKLFQQARQVITGVCNRTIDHPLAG